MNNGTISPEREDELFWLWGQENGDPETEEWREDLTGDEALLVAQWDGCYEAGVCKLAQEILDTEARQGEPPAMDCEPEL